jgi:hypothetical protein
MRQPREERGNFHALALFIIALFNSNAQRIIVERFQEDTGNVTSTQDQGSCKSLNDMFGTSCPDSRKCTN